MHRDHYTQGIEIRRLFGTPVALGAAQEAAVSEVGEEGIRRYRLAVARPSEQATG
jgi:hypothetical protein